VLINNAFNTDPHEKNLLYLDCDSRYNFNQWTYTK